MASKKDYILVAVIGILVGLLAQPVLSNTIQNIHNVLPLPYSLIRIVTLVFFALLAPFALFVASLVGSKIPVIFQFAKFGAVGSLNSFVDLGIFNLLTYFLGGNPALLSNSLFFGFKSLSFLAATTNSYIWNKNWTFGNKDETHTDTVVKFFAITALTYLLNTGVATGIKALGPLGGVPVNVWVNVVAPVVGILAAMMANFLSYKFIVFKNKITGPSVQA